MFQSLQFEKLSYTERIKTFCVLLFTLFSFASEAAADSHSKAWIAHLQLPGLSKNFPDSFGDEHVYRIDLTQSFEKKMDEGHTLECFVRSQNHGAVVTLRMATHSKSPSFIGNLIVAELTDEKPMSASVFTQSLGSVHAGLKKQGSPLYFYLISAKISPYHNFLEHLPLAKFVNTIDYELQEKMQCSFYKLEDSEGKTGF